MAHAQDPKGEKSRPRISGRQGCLDKIGLMERFTVHGLRRTFNDLTRRAGAEPRPADLDLAVMVANAEEAVPLVSLAKRRLSQITHLSDVFVFDAAENYVGRICQRSPSNCPTRSVECIPGCGAIKCLKIVPGFNARPDILAGARLLWPLNSTASSA